MRPLGYGLNQGHGQGHDQLPLAKGGGCVFTSVCVCVCLSVCPLDYAKSYGQILMKFFGWVGRGPWRSRLVQIVVHL